MSLRQPQRRPVHGVDTICCPLFERQRKLSAITLSSVQANETEELIPGLLFLFQTPKDAARNRSGTRLLHTPHDHA